MSNEYSSSDRFIIRIVTTLVVGAVLLASIIAGSIILHDRQMINAGFHRECYLTPTGEYWAK